MQITLRKKVIREMVSGFIKVIAKKPTLPVLGHILFSYDGNEATGTVTDLDQRLTYVLPGGCFSGDKGEFLFPLDEFRKLKSAVTKKDDTAVLTPVSEDEVELKTGQGDRMLTRKIGSMSTEEFPVDNLDIPKNECDTGKLLAAFKKAAVTVSADTNRIVMQGVYGDPDREAFIGTDGKRLSIFHLENYPFNSDFIVPASRVLCKFFDDKECQGYAGLLNQNNSQYFGLQKGNWRYQCRCTEGMFPNFEQVIPGDDTDWQAGITFSDEDTEIVESAVKQFPDSQEKTTYFLGNEHGAVLCARDDNKSLTGLKLKGCEVYSQEPVTFSVNREFLLDALRQGFRHGHIPGDFSPLKFRNQSDLHVLMPQGEDVPEDIKVYADELIGKSKPVKSQENKPETNTHQKEDNKVAKTENKQQDNAPQEAETSKASAQSSKQQSAQSQKQGLHVVESEDPMEALKSMFAETQESVRQANNAMRELRKQITAVERHYKDREKNLRSREKELEKNLKLIEKVQDAVNT